MLGYTSMALNPLNSGDLEQLALKGLNSGIQWSDVFNLKAEQRPSASLETNCIHWLSEFFHGKPTPPNGRSETEPLSCHNEIKALFRDLYAIRSRNRSDLFSCSRDPHRLSTTEPSAMTIGRHIKDVTEAEATF